MTPTINSKRKFYLDCAVCDKLQSIVSFGAAFTKTLSIFNTYCHQHQFFAFGNSNRKFTCINCTPVKYLNLVPITVDSLILTLQQKSESFEEVPPLLNEENENL